MAALEIFSTSLEDGLLAMDDDALMLDLDGHLNDKEVDNVKT